MNRADRRAARLPDLGALVKPEQPRAVQIGLAAIIAHLPANGAPFDGEVMDGESLAKMFRTVVREELEAWSESVIREAVRQATEP